MLILLPPSETKNPAGRGRPLDLSRLSFPELTRARERVLGALIATSSRPDAVRRLGVPPGRATDVLDNIGLRSTRTLLAERLYTGVLYDALDLAGLDAAARRRARRWIVVTSALYGAVRLGDPVAPYRLNACARLDGLAEPGGPGLPDLWRQELAPVLTAAVGRGLLVDCRSGSYVALWRPGGDLAERWVAVRVPGASHSAKHTRGVLARHLCTLATEPRTVPALAAAVAAALGGELHPPERPGRPWTLDVPPQ